MKTTSTFSILFWINTSRTKENKADLYARISRNGKRVNISLNSKVDLNLWDSKKSKAKGNSSEARRLNQTIALTRSRLYQSYLELKERGGIITAQSIKSRFLGEDIQKFTLRDLIVYHNEKNKKVLNKYTMRHYETSQRYLMEFVEKEYKTKDIYLRDLSYDFIVGLESFLRGYTPRHYQKSIQQNTVIKHIQRLRKMVTLAYHMEWIDRDPFVKFKLKVQKKERGFLTEREIAVIEAAEFPSRRLEIVRDLFIFSCYTGIAYCDIMLLTSDNLIPGDDGNDWIVAKRKKTSHQVKIPLLPRAVEIIHKYQNLEKAEKQNELLPRISNQKLNSYLKEIATQAQIKKKLTFHMARHTFATTITLSNGVPLETISKLLGHSELKTTQVYAKVVEKKVSEDMMLLRKKIVHNTKTETHIHHNLPDMDLCYHYKESV